MSDEKTSGLWSNPIFQKLYWAHVISLLGSGISSVALGLLAHALVGASASQVLAGGSILHRADRRPAAAKAAIVDFQVGIFTDPARFARFVHKCHADGHI